MAKQRMRREGDKEYLFTPGKNGSIRQIRRANQLKKEKSGFDTRTRSNAKVIMPKNRDELGSLFNRKKVDRD